MRSEDIGSWIGGRLRELREKRGLSLRELGRRAGVTTEMASRAEKNVKTPSVQTLARLCEGLDVSLSEFFGGSAGHRPVGVLDDIASYLEAVEPAPRRLIIEGFRHIARGTSRIGHTEPEPTLRAASPKHRYGKP